MSILSAKTHLYKLFVGLFLVIAVQSMTMSLPDYISTVERVQAAKCSNGTCG